MQPNLATSSIATKVLILTQPIKHSHFDDAQGLIFGTISCGLGLQFLTYAGFVTGQTAGLALLISYATGWGFGAVFFAINIPFYWIGYRRIGWAFTIKSLVAVSLLSLISAYMPGLIQFSHLNPWLAGVLYGCTTGAGLLALFRHGASLGGIGVLGLIIQDRTGFKAGWFQMAFDFVLFLAALAWLPLAQVAWSVPGVVILNLVLAINHRRDRYIGL